MSIHGRENRGREKEEEAIKKAQESRLVSLGGNGKEKGLNEIGRFCKEEIGVVKMSCFLSLSISLYRWMERHGE